METLEEFHNLKYNPKLNLVMHLWFGRTGQ